MIATAAAATGTGAYPAFRAGDLIVLPAASWWRGRLRAVQCPATDPVSCALLEGSGTARFPEVLGLSAKDCARRAVAEHRAWLESTAGRRHWPPHLVLTTLLAAARAACFLESVDRGAPELAITADAVADELAARGAGDAAEAARAATWAARVDAIPPPDPTVVAVRREVERMPAYAEPRRFYREGKGELANPQPPPASPVARSRRGST